MSIIVGIEIVPLYCNALTKFQFISYVSRFLKFFFIIFYTHFLLYFAYSVPFAEHVDQPSHRIHFTGRLMLLKVPLGTDECTQNLSSSDTETHVD